ncbi:MAG: porin [Verrucomicrobia bacterium]|nr:porin [Verrucomicrobiota bacterium]
MKNLSSAARTALVTALTVVGLTTTSLHAQAPTSDDINALREQIRQLDQKLRVLERNQELRDETAAAATKAQPKITINDKGVSLASADGANYLKLHGLVQADSRWFFGADGPNNNDAFLIRRARLIFEGAFAKNYEYLIVPEFGGTSGSGTLTLLDAYINVNLRPEFQVRAGRFREPVGLEQLQSDAVAFFAERSLVSQFVPNRDIGVQLWGDLLNGTLGYAIGAFNGVPDASSNTTNTDANNEKNFAGRLFAQPFKNDKDSVLAGLGFGVGASIGKENNNTGGLTSGYKTDGQQTWFVYNAGVVANGSVSRVSPQAYYYRGPFGLLAEYVVSSVEARNSTGVVQRQLQNDAWQIAAGYVLTGEDASYKGVTPNTNFSLSDDTWGAFEVVGRIAGANIDNGAFTGPSATRLANPSVSADQAQALSVGLNWYLSKTVRASFDYFHTNFKYAPGAAPAGSSVISHDENAFVTRLQLNF